MPPLTRDDNGVGDGIQAANGARFPFSPPMRPAPLLACLAALLAAGCFGRGRRGAIDESRFRPASDPELQNLLGDYPTPGPSPSDEIHDQHGAVVAFPADRARFADEVVAYEVGVPAPIPEG